MFCSLLRVTSSIIVFFFSFQNAESSIPMTAYIIHICIYWLLASFVFVIIMFFLSRTLSLVLRPRAHHRLWQWACFACFFFVFENGRCVGLVQQGPLMVQEAAISLVSAAAEAAEEEFGCFYDRVMPFLTQVRGTVVHTTILPATSYTVRIYWSLSLKQEKQTPFTAVYSMI